MDPRLATKAEEEAAHQAYMLEVRERQNTQFRKLKEQAQAIFRSVKGLPGVEREEQWRGMLQTAEQDLESGQFLMSRIGAKRYLDPELMAALVQLRQGLLSQRQRPTASDRMLADTAIVAYRQFLRVQEWIDNICLVVERGLFGVNPACPDYGAEIVDDLERRISQLENQLLPLLERSQRVMIRAIDRLNGQRRSSSNSLVAIGIASNVNVTEA